MRSLDRILTTHVGSLVRPDDLVAFMRRRMEGRAVDEAAYEACLNKSVVDVVRKQVDVGVDIISDGEFGKAISWSRYVLQRLQGFEQQAVDTAQSGMPKAVVGQDRRDFADFYAEYDPTQNFVGMSGWVVTSPIRYKG